MAKGLITPDQPRRNQPKRRRRRKVQEALDKKRKADDEHQQLHDFWQKELGPQCAKLRARTLDFPGGMPGDVGIFLWW
jgi:uncharacterized protein YigA (DUF484 family)